MLTITSGTKANRYVLAGLIALFLVMTPVKSRSLELGLAPSHVYSLWQNINRALLVYSKVVPGSTGKTAELTAMQPAVFKGKIPSDVYILATTVSKQLAGHVTLPSGVPDWLIDYERGDLMETSREEVITPSAVFILSMQLLNGIVDVVVENTDKEQQVSDFFAPNTETDKTPSDVYGLVDLALRRINLLLDLKN
jgi:hypothetical protein